MAVMIGVLKKALLFATLITTVGFVIAEFLSVPCVTLFAKDSPELIDMSAHALRLLGLFFPMIGPCIVCTAFFQSINKPGMSIFLSLTRQLLFIIPALYILPLIFSENPVEGVWWAYPTSDIMAFVLSMTVLYVNVKKFSARKPLGNA